MPAPHRLRRLEVQGFKSFAARTSFDFGPGITAIVGPNGSGKSNLADALRWVLGEQNPRVLRLKKLEDVIFAGGSKRAQSGLAEVSIVLDNSDAWLPLDFAEVMVTRRLHRSGDSEYLINRSRVRLRDVIDLFLKAKLGQNSYAILGQGMVDTVLSLRPEERRILIEEAADVRRHRIKIDEALAQLAATRENRDRVDLLLAEIGPRLEHLAKQARRASEHGRLSQELSTSLRRHYGLRLASARASRATAEKDLESAVVALDLARRALVQSEQRQTETGQQLALATSDLAQKETAWREATDRLHELERRTRELADHLHQRSNRRQELSAELLALDAEVTALQADAASAPQSVADLNQVRERVGSCEAELRQAGAAVEQARQMVATAETARRQSQESQAQVRDRLMSLQREGLRFEQERARLHERHRAALSKMARWAGGFRDLRESDRDLTPQLRSARTVAADTGRQAQAAAAALAEAEQQLQAMSRSIEDGTRRLELLQQERDARRPAQETVVALLDALRGGGAGRPRVLGILGGLIHVQQGMETAIEAALADALSGLVVRTQTEALAAVDVLKENETGRLSFFALEEIRGPHPLTLASEAGVVGVASRFVRCDDVYRDLVDSLLGRTVIVESGDMGRQILRRGLGAVVTLDGTVLKPSGLVSGGRAKSDGVLFRAARELSELQLELEHREKRRLELYAVIEPLKEQAALAGAAQRKAASAASDLQQRQANLADRANMLRRDFQPLRGELEWLRGSLRERLAAVAAVAGQVDELQAKLSDRASQVSPHEAAAAAARARLDAALDRQRQTAARAAEARGELNALERERASLDKLVQSRQAAVDRTGRLRAAREQLLAETETDLQGTEAALARQRDDAAALQELVKQLGDAIAPIRARAAELTGRQAEGTKALADCRRSTSTSESTVLAARLAAQTAEHQLAILRDELDSADWAIGLDAAALELPERAKPGDTEEQLSQKIRVLRQRIRGLGAVNAEAEADYRDSRERHQFLSAQVADLRQAELAILDAIEELRGIVRGQFRATFETVNADFQRFFRTFFGGGQAYLMLGEPSDDGDAGVDITAQPPGKRLQSLAMLSGGERSMTAVALLFALLETKPAPFCVLDEVDAALDESNVDRFSGALAGLAQSGQFLVVTHNRATVQAADHIYGVSMTEEGVSQVLSMRLSEAASLLE